MWAVSSVCHAGISSRTGKGDHLHKKRELNHKRCPFQQTLQLQCTKAPSQHSCTKAMSLLSTLQYRRRRLLWILVANCFILSTLSTQSSSTCTTATAAIFGIRGGGLFGFGKRSNKNGTGGDDDDDKPKRFPALTREEVEEKLNIPVFGITDQNGNGVILSDNQSGNNIFHFFFSKHMADAALRAVSAANMDAPELKVSAFHLGKCWFKLINCSGSKMFKLQKYGEGNGEEHTKPIHFRLVPNMKGEFVQTNASLSLYVCSFHTFHY